MSCCNSCACRYLTLLSTLASLTFLILLLLPASSPQQVLEEHFEKQQNLSLLERFKKQQNLSKVFSTLAQVKEDDKKTLTLKDKYKIEDPAGLCKAINSNACQTLSLGKCDSWNGTESMDACRAANVDEKLCFDFALLCGHACQTLSTIKVDYAPFKHFASLPIQNAYLLSRFACLHASGLPDFTKGPDEVGSPTEDSCTDGHNLFTSGNLIFVTRARATILSDEWIFAAGTCLGDGRQQPRHQCFYMHRKKGDSRNTPDAIDHVQLITVPYPVPEWYQIAHTYSEETLKAKGQGQLLRNVISGSLLPNEQKVRLNAEPVHLEYNESLWTKPYFDCELGHAWMITYSAPVVYSVNGNLTFIGMTAIDIALNNTNINQCPPDKNESQSGFNDDFQDTHLCDEKTTYCEVIPNQGFVTGSYRCRCQPGYYRHGAAIGQPYFNGSEIEEALKNESGETWRTNITATEGSHLIRTNFKCLRCPVGCDDCHDGTEKCVYESSNAIFIGVTIVNGLVVLIILLLMWFVVAHRGSYTVRSSSWPFLLVILIGSFLAYVGVLTKYEVSHGTCITAPLFIYIGFACTFGSITIKTWRIKEIFSSKTMRVVVQKRRLSNKDLAVRLAFIVSMYAALLGVWLIGDGPSDTVDKSAGLKYKRCTVGTVHWVLVAAQFALILPSIYFSFKLRNVDDDFAEQKQIIISIYIFTLVKIVVLIAANSIDQKPDIVYLISSVEMFLTFGATVALWFAPKVHRVFRPSLKDIVREETKQHHHLTRNNGARWERRQGIVSLEGSYRDSYSQMLSEESGSMDYGTRFVNRLSVPTSGVIMNTTRRSTWAGSPLHQPRPMQRNTPHPQSVLGSVGEGSIMSRSESPCEKSLTCLTQPGGRKRNTSTSNSLRSLRDSVSRKFEFTDRSLSPLPHPVGKKRHRNSPSTMPLTDQVGYVVSVLTEPRDSGESNFSLESSPEAELSPDSKAEKTVLVFPICKEEEEGEAFLANGRGVISEIQAGELAHAQQHRLHFKRRRYQSSPAQEWPPQDMLRQLTSSTNC